ncbi:MAG: hypothetical protein NTY30_02540 [Candidatus Berkelbacteria bacterium]|nr:hypothetical protein [Candidatus Berkelbacteria bacterium]
MEENKELSKSIDKLIKVMHRSNSLGWMLLKGIFYSIGWIIGLGLIATILFYLLPKTGDGNIIGHWLHSMANAVRQSQ